jgi:hypothetical protein
MNAAIGGLFTSRIYKILTFGKRHDDNGGGHRSQSICRKIADGRWDYNAESS